MSIVTSAKDNDFTIKVYGNFDYSIQQDFRIAYESANKSMKFIVDFSAAEYMDSAALGMLLIMREYIGNDRSKTHIILARCSDEIKSILDISQFGKLFTIS